MPRVKITNLTLRNTESTYPMWKTLEERGINAWEIKKMDHGKTYFVTLDNGNLEKLIAHKEIIENCSLFDKYAISKPLNYNAMRTVVVQKIDQMHIGRELQELQDTIERQNATLEVEEVIKLPNINHILKIKFKTTLMADICIEEGVKINNQFIPPQYIHKEIFVNLKPCYRCYKYNHGTNKCRKDINYKICSECGQEGHIFNECKNPNKKCINCGNNHRTLAAACEIRKKIIKDKSRSLRKQQTKPSYIAKRQNTYNAKGNYQPKGNDATQVKPPNVITNFMAKLISNLTFAFITERQHKGTFQKTMDEMNKLNNMPSIIYPANINTDNFEIIMESLGDITTAIPEQENTQIITPIETLTRGTQGNLGMHGGEPEPEPEPSTSKIYTKQKKSKPKKGKRNRMNKQKEIDSESARANLTLTQENGRYEITDNDEIDQHQLESTDFDFDMSLLKEGPPSPDVLLTEEEHLECTAQEQDSYGSFDEYAEQREAEAHLDHEEYLRTSQRELSPPQPATTNVFGINIQKIIQDSLDAQARGTRLNPAEYYGWGKTKTNHQ